MKRLAVNSTSIKSMGFDGDVVEVEFASGSIYRYAGVSREIFDEVLASESIGRAFQAAIRNQFTGELIPKEDEVVAQ